MTRHKIVLFGSLIGLLTALASVALLMSGHDANTYYRYATYSDIQKDKSVKAASVPTFVPGSAVDIAGWYNIELDEQTLEFEFDPKEMSVVVDRFAEARGAKAEAIKREIKRYSWGNLDDRAGLLFYERDGEKGHVEYLVIDPTRARAFYETTRKKALNV